MAIIKSKWLLIAGIPALSLIVLYLIGRKSVHAEIIIKASPEKVWGVLTDKASYTEWNTVLIPIEGELKEGAKVKYEFYQDTQTMSVIPSKVKQMLENELLNQAGGLPGVLTYNHKYLLEAHDDGTRLTIHEDYRGIAVPFWNPAPVQVAYERLCKNLKDRAETS